MLSLPTELDNRCFALFMRCDEFESTRSLLAFCVTDELAPFGGCLPQRNGSKKDFVTEAKYCLLTEHLADGRALLLPFLATLVGRYPKEQDLSGELEDLYQQVLRHAAGRAPTDPHAPAAPNPFVPWRGRLTGDALFCGREQELRELTALIASRQSVSLLGDRRAGKSSLLYQLIGRAAKLDPAPQCLYVDLLGVENEADFYELVLQKLGQAGNTWRAFRNGVQGRYILLALDEFEKAQSVEHFSVQWRNGLRSLASDGLTLVVATRQPLDRLFADGVELSPLYNLCQRYPLDCLSADAARNLYATYLAPTRVQFTAAELEEAIALSGGHPGQLQQLGWHLYRAHTTPRYDWRAAYAADPKE